MMKKFRSISMIFLFTSILFISYSVSSVQANRSLRTEIHTVTINDAYYIGYDIFTSITVTIDTDSNIKHYYLRVCLTNPIGEQEEIVLHIITSLKTLTLDITFYNYATESGDYSIEATLITNDNGWFAVTDVVVFDPPGGSEGDPYIRITIP